MKFFTLWTTAVICFLTQIMSVSETSAAKIGCPHIDVTVHAELPSDITFACSAAEETYAFLKNIGTSNLGPVKIFIVDKMIKTEGYHSLLGQYEAESAKAIVLSYKSCKRVCSEECFCGLDLSRSLHTSIIIHEIAHALADANLPESNKTTAAQEYVAYTTQISLMPKDLRSRILSQYNNQGFSNEDEITSLFHDLNPAVFAVKAYRHFIQPHNGKTFYEKLISGQVILKDTN